MVMMTKLMITASPAQSFLSPLGPQVCDKRALQLIITIIVIIIVAVATVGDYIKRRAVKSDCRRHEIYRRKPQKSPDMSSQSGSYMRQIVTSDEGHEDYSYRRKDDEPRLITTQTEAMRGQRVGHEQLTIIDTAARPS